MMSYLAEKCTIIFESKNIINISSIIGILGIVLIGILTNHLIDALIYEGMFLITRRKLGGYHCKSYLGCISSYLLLFIVVLILDMIIMLLIVNQNSYYLTIIYTLSIITLLMIGGKIEYEIICKKSDELDKF